MHQQTQRTYAIAGANGEHSAVVLLDANLQVVAIVEDVDAAHRPMNLIPSKTSLCMATR